MATMTLPERLTESPVSRLRQATVPARLRVLLGVAAALAVALGAIITMGARGIDGGLTQIGQRSEPQAVATADLYLALNDMDSQVANVLLAGGDPALAATRSDALRIYEQRRLQADHDIQQAAAAAGNNTPARRSLRTLIDGLGAYEGLAAQAIELDGQKAHPGGKPPAPVLQRYRQATDQLKSQVLPAAQSLTDANAAALDRTYQSRRGLAGQMALWTGLVGLALIAVLAGLQVFLTRRFRRWINPGLALATVAVLGLTVAGVGMFTAESEHLRVAKKDAFDSVLWLSKARAVAFDANADESRYLADPGRAGQYQAAFLSKSEQLVQLPGAAISTYDTQLASALAAYRKDHADLRFHGFYGSGLRNITFPGERAAAERTLSAYQAYQLDDRRIRSLAAAGDLKGAIALDTGYTAHQSNADFGAYTGALDGWLKINQSAFDRAIRDGHGDLSGWALAPAIAVFAILGLAAIGVRPRLAEYR